MRLYPLLILALALPSFAQDEAPAAPVRETVPAPSADEIMKVVKYFYGNVDSAPQVYSAQLCGKVEKKTMKCVDPVGATVKKGTTVNLLTHWFAPKGSKFDDIRVEWLHEGESRRTSDVAISGALRYRVIKAKRLGKKGTWEVRVRRGDTVLKSMKVTAE